MYNLGIKESEAEKLIEKYKANGLYEQYRNLSEEDYEAILRGRKEPPKNKFEIILNKYKLDSDSIASKYLLELLEYINLNKNASIKEAYTEIAKRHRKDKQQIQNAIYRMTSANQISLSQLLKDELDWKEVTRKFIRVSKESEEVQEDKIKESVICDITQNNNAEIAENKEKEAESINNEFTSEITNLDNVIVKVSVRTLLELQYYRGYVEALKKSGRGE